MAALPGTSSAAPGPGALVSEAIALNSVKSDDRSSGAEDLFAFHHLRNILKDALQLKPTDLLATLRADVDKRLYMGERWRLSTVADRVMLDRPDGPTRKLGDNIITREQLRGAFALQPGRYELPEALRGTLVGPKPKKIVIRMPGSGGGGGAAKGKDKRKRDGLPPLASGVSGGSDTQDTGGGSRATALTARTATTGSNKRQRSRTETPG